MQPYAANEITGANAGGPHQSPVRARWSARIAQFCRFGVASAPMKIAMTCLMVIQLLAACSRRDEPKPASQVAGRNKMAGNWLWTNAYMKGAFTVESNGNYVGVLKRVGSNHLRNIEMQGVMEIKDGVMIETVTKDTQTNGAVPRTSRAQIIRMDEREMVLRWEGLESDVILRRLNQ